VNCEKQATFTEGESAIIECDVLTNSHMILPGNMQVFWAKVNSLHIIKVNLVTY